MSVSRPALVIGLLIALVMASGLSVIAGRVWVPFEVWWSDAADPRWLIILELRIPRTLLAIIIGFGLGLTGAALQGYTRNPLADPGVLGVAGLAALGAVLTMFLGLSAAAVWVLPLGAIVGAISGVVVLLLLSGSTSSILTFILAGVILNAIASAGVALVLSLSPNPWALNEIVNWLMGSLSDRSRDDVLMAFPFVAAGCAMILTLPRALDALTLGETGAQSLGIDLGRTRKVLALGVGLATGACVAATGIIGFVGLITPHLMRPLVGAKPGALLIPSGLAGAVLVLVADVVVRLIPAAAEVKLGVVMAALGGPFFLALLVAVRRRLA